MIAIEAVDPAELHAAISFLLKQNVTESLLEEMDALDIITLANRWRELEGSLRGR